MITVRKSRITSDDIFDKISDYDIYRYYVGKPFRLGGTITSPFRQDRNPSFSIYKCGHTGKIKWIDYSRGDKGDCIEFVKRRFNCSFPEALNIIDNDFTLGIRSVTYKAPSMGIVGTSDLALDEHIDQVRKQKVIEINKEVWCEQSTSYWAQYGVTIPTLDKYDVHSIKYYWIDDERYSVKGLGFAYKFDDKFKIYQPLNKQFKWCSNSGDVIQGYEQLPDGGKLLVITKSLKDVMLLHELGIPAVAFHSESFVPNETIIEEFFGRFVNVVSNYDWDKAGQHTAWAMRKKYGIQAYMINVPKMPYTRVNTKDLSDYCKVYGTNKTKKLITELL